MKKIFIILLITLFSFSVFAQEKKLSNYEKYRIEKEKKINETQEEVFFIVEDMPKFQINFVLDDLQESESVVINNYYNDYNEPNYRFLLTFGYSYPYNYGYYNPYYYGGYFGYQPWFFRYHWNYWNTSWYYGSYYIYNSSYYYADRDYYRNRYWNRRNTVIRHRNTPNPYRNYSPYNRSNPKTKVVAQKEPVKVNRTVYLDKNTRRNVSGINNKVNNRRTTTYKSTYINTRSKRPAYNSNRRIGKSVQQSRTQRSTTVRTPASTQRSTYNRPSSSSNKSYSRSSSQSYSRSYSAPSRTPSKSYNAPSRRSSNSSGRSYNSGSSSRSSGNKSGRKK